MQATATGPQVDDAREARDTEPPGSRLPERYQALDLLRGVALLLVMGRHMQVTPVWYRLGWLGVQLFFVLSGFLVAGLLYREYRQTGRLDLRRFLLRRAFKIYPGFYLFLAVTLPLGLFSPQPPRGPEVLSELFFLQSYLPGYWEHTWSLAVEEHFYLLLAAGFLLLTRRGSGSDPFASVPAITAGVALAALTARCAVTAWLPFNHLTHVFATHARLDALAFGVCLAYWFHYRGPELREWVIRRRALVVGASAACLLPFAFLEITSSRFVTSVGMTLGYLGLGGLLLVLLVSLSDRKQEKQPWSERVLAWLGRNSYGIYLWHMAVALWGVGKLQTLLNVNFPYAVEVVIYFAASILLGAAATWWVEQPLLRLRDRYFPSRSGRLAGPGPVPIRGELV